MVSPRLSITGDHQRWFRGRLAGQTPHCGDVGRVVLPVSVECRDPGRICRLDACADRRTLPVTSRVTQQPHLRRSSRGPQDLGGGRIVATVIYEDNLITDQTVERGANFADERGDIFSLVLYRDDDGKIYRRGYVTPFGGADKSMAADALIAKCASSILHFTGRSR